MRKEKDLNVPDVHTHALRAADRVGSNGQVHDADRPQLVSGWRDYFKWETLHLAHKTIEKGFVVTPSMALTLFLAFGSVLGFMYNRMAGQIAAKDAVYQDQRDMLVEIRTELRLKKESDAESQRKQKEATELQEMKLQDLKERFLVFNAKRGK